MGTLPGVYTPTVGRRLLVEIGRASDILLLHRAAFAELIGAAASHLSPIG